MLKLVGSVGLYSSSRYASEHIKDKGPQNRRSAIAKHSKETNHCPKRRSTSKWLEYRDRNVRTVPSHNVSTYSYSYFLSWRLNHFRAMAASLPRFRGKWVFMKSGCSPHDHRPPPTWRVRVSFFVQQRWPYSPATSRQLSFHEMGMCDPRPTPSPPNMGGQGIFLCAATVALQSSNLAAADVIPSLTKPRYQKVQIANSDNIKFLYYSLSSRDISHKVLQIV